MTYSNKTEPRQNKTRGLDINATFVGNVKTSVKGVESVVKAEITFDNNYMYNGTGGRIVYMGGETSITALTEKASMGNLNSFEDAILYWHQNQDLVRERDLLNPYCASCCYILGGKTESGSNDNTSFKVIALCDGTIRHNLPVGVELFKEVYGGLTQAINVTKSLNVRFTIFGKYECQVVAADNIHTYDENGTTFVDLNGNALVVAISPAGSKAFFLTQGYEATIPTTIKGKDNPNYQAHKDSNKDLVREFIAKPLRVKLTYVPVDSGEDDDDDYDEFNQWAQYEEPKETVKVPWAINDNAGKNAVAVPYVEVTTNSNEKYFKELAANLIQQFRNPNINTRGKTRTSDDIYLTNAFGG